MIGAIFLTLARQAAWYLVLEPNGWDFSRMETKSALSSMVAMAHSTLLLLPLHVSLVTHPTRKPSALMKDSSPKWNYTAACVISYCTAYMLQDAFHIFNAAYAPVVGAIGTMNLTSDDTMFLAHHFITLAYMLSAHFIGAGHYSAMLLMYFGEITNPVHNTYLICEIAAALHPGPNVETLLFYSFKVFVVFYAAVRIVLGPILGVWIIYDLIVTKAGRAKVPLVASVLWCTAMVGVLHGSFGYAKKMFCIENPSLSLCEAEA
jgi:hypothetical protein